MDSSDVLKKALKEIEIELDDGTTDTDKFGRTLSYHETIFKKCLENEEFLKIYKQLPIEEQIAWVSERYEKVCKILPKSVVSLIPGAFHFGIAPRSLTEIPDWLDMEKFRKGQEFVKKNLGSTWLGILYGVNVLYTFEDGVVPILATGKSTTPYESFKRYLSTMKRMNQLFLGDPWTEGSPAHKEVNNIRIIHISVWNKLQKYDNETIRKGSTLKNPYAPSYKLIRKDLQANCPIFVEGQCPFNLWSSESPKKLKPMQQVDMALVQFSFIAYVLLKPEFIGIHDATDENLEAFCHMWKGIAYLLGIQDEFNICSGTLEEIKQRVKDLMEYWIKPNLQNYLKDSEHVLRAVFEGISYYYPLLTYEIAILDVAEILELDMTNFRASLSYSMLIYYNIYKFLIRRVISIEWFKKMINASFDYAFNRALAFDDKKHAELKEKSAKSVLNTSVIEPLPFA